MLALMDRLPSPPAAVATILGMTLLSFLPTMQAQTAESPSTATTNRVIVASFNVHYVAAGQERLDWERRKEAVAAAIAEGEPEIVAFQEMETFDGGHFSERNLQLDFLLERFPRFQAGAVGDPRVYPWTQPILFLRERFELLEQGFFFFSPTPDQIYSDPWDGRYPAFCSWIRLRERDGGRGFYVYNVHFDYGSRENRLRSARLVRRRIARREHRDEPVILAGDFNAPRFFRTVRILTEAGFTVAETTGSTVHFARGINLLPAIDHILYSPGLIHEQTVVLRKRYDGVWPSDHYPVFVTLLW